MSEQEQSQFKVNQVEASKALTTIQLQQLQTEVQLKSDQLQSCKDLFQSSGVNQHRVKSLLLLLLLNQAVQL